MSLFFQGYLPANVDRRESTLQRKRKEYFAFVEQYYDSRNDENHQDTYRQVGHLLNWLLSTKHFLKDLESIFGLCYCSSVSLILPDRQPSNNFLDFRSKIIM